MDLMCGTLRVMPPRISLPLLAVGAAAVLAGCGSTASGSTGGYGAPAASTSAAVVSGHVQTLKLTADPHGALRFNTTHLTAKAGKVKIVLTNPSGAGMPHGIAIQGHGSSPVVAAGKTTSVTATLKKGRYTFLCPVPGHAAAGMKGTLTVT
jgi:plastocyanin